ncbi:MAG: hypothetical protein K2N72_09180 [Oscillospiraceae bacterium]|nr:hypothetical protein [Oscillospiraceae bacterium]
MSKQLDRIMRISDKGYIDNFNDIEEILEHFLSYTVETLTSVLPPGLKVHEFADNIVRKLGNMEFDSSNTDYTESLRISDLLCIMRYFELSYSDSDTILLSYMKNLRSNICGLKVLPWAELFLSISVDSLMKFFTSKTGSLEYMENCWRICISAKKCANFSMTKQTTLQMLLDGICGDLFASWNPGFDTDEYIDKIENCCLIVKQVFVDGIAAWYYNRFDILELSKSIEGKVIKFDKPNDDCDDDDDEIYELPF